LRQIINEYLRDQMTTIDRRDLSAHSSPKNTPTSARTDWRPAQGKPGSSYDDMKRQALDRFQVAYGICNPPYGVQMVFSEDMQDAFCRALNDWLAKGWVDKGERPRGARGSPAQST